MHERAELGEPISVRFPPQDRAALERLAAADDRPLAALVRRLVRQALQHREQERAA
jgi:hypothetical protein